MLNRMTLKIYEIRNSEIRDSLTQTPFKIWNTGESKFECEKDSKEEIRQDMYPPVYSNLVELKVIAN